MKVKLELMILGMIYIKVLIGFIYAGDVMSRDKYKFLLCIIHVFFNRLF